MNTESEVQERKYPLISKLYFLSCLAAVLLYIFAITSPRNRTFLPEAALFWPFVIIFGIIGAIALYLSILRAPTSRLPEGLEGKAKRAYSRVLRDEKPGFLSCLARFFFSALLGGAIAYLSYHGYQPLFFEINSSAASEEVKAYALVGRKGSNVILHSPYWHHGVEHKLNTGDPAISKLRDGTLAIIKIRRGPLAQWIDSVEFQELQ